MSTNNEIALAMRQALEALETCEQHGYIPVRNTRDSITSLRVAIASYSQAIAEAEKQQCYCGDITRLGVVHRADSFCDEHPDPKVTGEWKLVPRNPTEEMLVAMDECAEEGYDERLYAGMAASVFMAAVDAAPNLPEADKQEQQPKVRTGNCLLTGVCASEGHKIQKAAVKESLTTQQEPVAWMHPTNNQCISHLRTTYTSAIPLYTSPPQRQPLEKILVGTLLYLFQEWKEDHLSDMTTHKEALKLALEGAANYIDVLGGDSKKYRQLLAQPEQSTTCGEPVALRDKT